MRTSIGLLLVAIAVVGVRAQAPADCVSIFAAFRAGNVTITPAAAATDCCEFLAPNGPDKNADGYFENFVECAGGRVTRIQLIGYNIDSLSNLTALTLLTVHDNLIAEPLPSWLPNLVNLEKLNLNDNFITGTTGVLGQLRKTTYIDVSGNLLTGNPSWLATSTQLSTIILEKNQLSGTFPDISGLTNLTSLRIGDNQFTGALPSTTSFPALLTYSVYSNKFTGAIPALTNNPLLITFNVNNNSLTGSLPDPSNCPKLTYYGAQKNIGITGTIPAGVFKLANLQTLVLSDDSLSGPLGSGLSDMVQLSTLYLDGNTKLNGTMTAGTDFCSLANTNLCLVGGNVNSIPSRCQTGGGKSLAACSSSAGTATSKSSGTGTASASSTATAGGQSSSDTGSGGSSLGPIIGGVVGGIAALGLIGGLAWYFGRRRGTKEANSPPSTAPGGPPSQPYAPLDGQSQFYAPQYGQPVPQMPPVSYANSPYSQGSMLSNVPQHGSPQNSGSLYNMGQYGSQVHLMAAPGSMGTLGSSISSTSTKVNEVYVVAQPFLASQEDEMTCEQGQKVFVSDVFPDNWCKALNLESMQSGVVPLAVLVPANQPGMVQSRMLSGSMYQPQARGQSIGAGSTIVSGDQALLSLRNYLDMGIINSQQYMSGSTVLGNSAAIGMHGDVKGPGAPSESKE
ncbi:hypothetical protein HDU93_008077 [Gonapodya sp. JEL0774]|nr:hypothetical protein HDU93_008077 [Gonapodya sp. JEL0774]